MTDTTAPMWQDIATAPKDGTLVLGWLRGWHVFPVKYFKEGNGFNEDEPGWYNSIDDVWLEPTHWMPLPAPPPLEG